MSKNINIHIKTPGAGKAKQQLEAVGQSAEHVGKQTASGAREGAKAVEQSSKKMTGMSRILGSLKTQVVGFVSAWFGLRAVQLLINWLIEKLERIASLQKTIYEKSLSLGEIGQALEFQTGTRGQQLYWAHQAALLQKAGGLKSSTIAQQMMVSMDIAFAKQGGIKSPQILAMASELAPFVGAAGLSGEEVAKVFEFAGTAGVAPTSDAYKNYFAKLQAGYTASKATNFGQFMIGLQKGGTASMAMGGTLQEAISTFAGARAVTANEALAATLVEQVARLSGGAYEKPRRAIERVLGVQWPTLSMDQRTDALFQYVAGIPESRRTSVLTRRGFPAELTTQIGKMVSPEAISTMAATRWQVAAATPAMIDLQTQAYLQSVLAQEYQTQGMIAAKTIKRGPQFAEWQRRLNLATAEHKFLVAESKDRWVLDRLEPYVMTLEELLAETKQWPDTPENLALQTDIQRSIGNMTSMTAPFYPKGMAARVGYQYTQRSKEFVSQPANQPVIINDNSTHYHPFGGDTKRELEYHQD